MIAFDLRADSYPKIKGFEIPDGTRLRHEYVSIREMVCYYPSIIQAEGKVMTLVVLLNGNYYWDFVQKEFFKSKFIYLNQDFNSKTPKELIKSLETGDEHKAYSFSIDIIRRVQPFLRVLTEVERRLVAGIERESDTNFQHGLEELVAVIKLTKSMWNVFKEDSDGNI